ncbi:MAG TPA: helix-turn-helix transcriptional regulator [Myxococcales bacterium]|nr:helix-turn-helix transcriptional regulator [Myxococcales bacterium]
MGRPLLPKSGTVPELNAKLATRLRQLRLSRALTQDELATKAGISTDAVRRLEYGMFSPTLRLLTQVAPVLGMTVAEVIDLGDDTPAGAPVERLAALLKGRPEHEVALVLRLARAAFAEE